MFPITSSCGCAAMSIAPACLIESISAETSLTVAVETRRRMISRVLRATSCDATCWRRRSSAMNREHSPATFGLIGGVAVALIGLAGALSTWHDLARGAGIFAPASQREPSRHRPTARSEHSEVWVWVWVKGQNVVWVSDERDAESPILGGVIVAP